MTLWVPSILRRYRWSLDCAGKGRSRPLPQRPAQQVGKHGGVTDVDAFGGCQQNHRPRLGHLAEVLDGGGSQGLAELCSVAAGELLEMLRIVAVPTPQLG